MLTQFYRVSEALNVMLRSLLELNATMELKNRKSLKEFLPLKRTS